MTTGDECIISIVKYTVSDALSDVVRCCHV